MIEVYVWLFCRILIGFVFGYASATKLRQSVVFMQAMEGLRLLPTRLVPAVAWLVIGLEAATALCLLVPGAPVMLGFQMALVLLIGFCGVLSLALQRKLTVRCHCFGATGMEISWLDIGRNLGFIACAVLGLAVVPAPDLLSQLTWESVLGVTAGAALLALLWMHLDDIVYLVRAA